MNIQAAIGGFLRHRFALWQRNRTERFLRNLPDEIQKDIGWPARGAGYGARDSLWERRF